MRVLLLSNNWEVAEPVRAFLEKCETVACHESALVYDKGHAVVDLCGKVCKRYNEILPPTADILVSYCYQHLIPVEVINYYHGKCVNLHNSYLPWGRGAQPLFWSAMDNEPCGVSIHWMDEGLDTGPLIARQRVEIHPEYTFRQMYEAQHRALAQLFRDKWGEIRETAGTHHTTGDFEAAKGVLTDGWDTVIAEARERWRG